MITTNRNKKHQKTTKARSLCTGQLAQLLQRLFIRQHQNKQQRHNDQTSRNRNRNDSRNRNRNDNRNKLNRNGNKPNRNRNDNCQRASSNDNRQQASSDCQIHLRVNPTTTAVMAAIHTSPNRWDNLKATRKDTCRFQCQT